MSEAEAAATEVAPATTEAPGGAFDKVEGDVIDVSGDGGVLKKIITPAPEGAKGPAPQGYEVTAHYTGTLSAAPFTEFDSSRKRGQPFKFRVGQGNVIKGWDLAFAGMKVGERAVIRIKSDFAYGDGGVRNSIPPKASLDFDVELLDYVEFKDPLDVALQALSDARSNNAPETEIIACLEKCGALFHQRNQVDKAKDALENAVRLYDMPKAEGTDPKTLAGPETLTSLLGQLGNLCFLTREFDESLAHHQRILDIEKERVGVPDHEDIATALTKLGRVYSRMENFAEARKLHKEALKMCERLSGGPDSVEPLLSASLNNLGRVSMEAKEFAQAREYFERALQKKIAFFQNKPVEEVAALYNNLGNAAFREDDLKSAEKYMEQALKVQVESQGDKRTVQTMKNSLDAIRKYKEMPGWQAKMRRYAKLKRERDQAKKRQGATDDLSLEERERLAEESMKELLAMEGSTKPKKSTKNKRKKKKKKK